jgi:hypothetical protein
MQKRGDNNMSENKKWEYKIETVGAVFGKWQVEKLNKIGDESWEAVGVFFDLNKSQMYILFKRQKVGQTQDLPPPPPKQ